MSDGKIDHEALVREMEAAWLRAPENARSARDAELCRMAAALAVAEREIRAAIAQDLEARADAVDSAVLPYDTSDEHALRLFARRDAWRDAAAAIRAREGKS